MSEGLASQPIALPFLAPTAAVVTRRQVECHDTVTLTIQPCKAYPTWQPGQFNMLYLFGLGEVPISISGRGAPTSSLNHTIKAIGPVTEALTRLEAGERLWIRGPFGTAWPRVESHHDTLLIAGGIGLAPLRPVILSALAANLGGKVIVLYGTRTPADILFAQNIREWTTHPRFLGLVTVDYADAKASWSGAVGVVTQLLHHVPLKNPQTTLVMSCGPEVMLRHVATDLMALGVRPRQIYVSLERNMKCALGFCGRCQWGPKFVCRDGPIYCLEGIRRFWSVTEF